MELGSASQGCLVLLVNPEDLCGTREIRTSRCLSQFHESLRHGNLRGFRFVEGAYYGADISFKESLCLRIVQAGGSVLKAVQISQGVSLTGIKLFPIVSENFQGYSFKGRYLC